MAFRSYVIILKQADNAESDMSRAGAQRLLPVVMAGPLLGLLAGPSTDRANAQVGPPDIVAQIDGFLLAWQEAWKASEGDRHSLKVVQVGWSDGISSGSGPVAPGQAPIRTRPGGPGVAYSEGARLGAFHCLPTWAGTHLRVVDPNRVGRGRPILDGRSKVGVCPSWTYDLGPRTSPDRQPPDEGEWIDNALSEPRRAAIRTARSELIATLDSAVRASPESELLTGQLTRFLVDQQMFDTALARTRSCRATAWWCGMLEGYVQVARKNFGTADSVFSGALTTMPSATRCVWNDIKTLLDSTVAKSYARLSCEARDSANAMIWWLADPLLSEPGNARRAAHYSRKVLVALRAALERDERYNWRTSAVHEARRQMIERYGWPSYTFWSGPDQELTYVRLLLISRENDPRINEIHTTYEYNVGRQHLFPANKALQSPFAAVSADWTINSPPGMDRPKLVEPLWWPQEHYAAPFPLVQLTDGQVAALRRDTSVLAGVATLLSDTAMKRVRGDIARAVLVASTGPEHARVVDTVPAVIGNVVRMSADLAPAPMMLGIEIDSARGVVSVLPAARSRFGYVPPPPLRAMRAGDVAISEPVLLDVNDDAPLPNTPDAALNRMRGSTRMERGPLGLYFETYGLAATDSVEFAVWIERSTKQGVLRRLGASMRVAQDLNTPVSVGWTETEPGPHAYVVTGGAGNVTIIGRSIRVHTGTLPAGEYRLEVAVRRVGAREPVRSLRTFVIQ